MILPAFGVTIDDFEELRALGCILVDTTCGSVLNVWKRVESYARDGFTALIHGKYYHEETRATASQVRKHAERALPHRARHGARRGSCATSSRAGRTRRTSLRSSRHAVVAGLRSRRAICSASASRTRRRCWRASRWRSARRSARRSAARAGKRRAREHFRTFDTICSATQERQDAVPELLREPLDAMVVIGGFNSSNTISLAALCAEQVPTYHVEYAGGIDPERGSIHFRRAAIKHIEADETDWLPATGPVRVGLTAGASTPNNKIGEAVVRILATRGVSPA